MTKEEDDAKILEENRLEMKKFFTRTFLPTPSYQFVMEYMETMDQLRTDDLPEYFSEQTSESVEFAKTFYKAAFTAGKQDINKELRMVEIEEDLVPILENTDNKIFYRPLFFPTIFINNDFKFETFVIKGLLIEDLPNHKNILAYIVAMDTDTYRILQSIVILPVEEKGTIKPLQGDEGKISRLNNHIRLLICNVIDMVDGNDEDLEVTTIVTTPEQNTKRVKRGKVPFPTKVFIRAKKEFKQYIKDFNDVNDECKETKLSCKFLVRGHWMHFRSERYIHRQGEKTWVKPFYKGQGIVVAKPYKIVK